MRKKAKPLKRNDGERKETYCSLKAPSLSSVVDIIEIVLLLIACN